MSELKEKLPSKEAELNYNVPVIKITPFLESKDAERQTESADAVILITYASGATPERLGEFVDKMIKNNIPVFLVSDNIADNHGILNIKKYETGAKIAEAGATAIEKINAKDVLELMKVIQKYLSEGLRGVALAEKVRDEFSYKPGELKPLAEWETPEGIAHLRESTKWVMQRSGLSGSELDKAMRQWEFGHDKPEEIPPDNNGGKT